VRSSANQLSLPLEEVPCYFRRAVSTSGTYIGQSSDSHLDNGQSPQWPLIYLHHQVSYKRHSFFPPSIFMLANVGLHLQKNFSVDILTL